MSIGETLTAARENAGLSVEQVAETTRIRRTLERCLLDISPRSNPNQKLPPILPPETER